MALKGIKVLEMAGLAPSPFCGTILRDFGADVIRVDKVKPGVLDVIDKLAPGKRSIAIDLKDPKGVDVVRSIAKQSDVFLEPYRKGVMEKLKLGPDELMKLNSKLVYARLSGYGHSGSLAKKAGHDINYIAQSGLLSFLGKDGSPPTFPINLLADFAGGGMICAFGICMALLERERSGLGQVIDSSMVEGSSYLSTWLWRSQDLFIWGNKRGKNVLDGGAAFYNTYKTKDDKYMAVGALESSFYSELLKGLGINEEEFPQPSMLGQEAIDEFSKIFSEKTQNEWVKIFENLDACVSPVLDRQTAPIELHNQQRNSFNYNDQEGCYEPNPAPKLSRTPGFRHLESPTVGQHSTEILKEYGYSKKEIDSLLDNRIISTFAPTSKL
ncbi:Alpha-methylacyl-CoA racemase [Nymphon striatum]|nr:Alpha-methylacyl-CoA racemase [Nymphon striatum]